MKKNFALVFLFAFILGCSVGKIVSTPEAAHASGQITSPTLVCGGTHNCSQYIVEVSTQRGYGRFAVYQVGDQSAVVDTTSCCTLVAGGTSVNMQATEAEPRQDQTFTLALSEP